MNNRYKHQPDEHQGIDANCHMTWFIEPDHFSTENINLIDFVGNDSTNKKEGKLQKELASGWRVLGEKAWHYEGETQVRSVEGGLRVSYIPQRRKVE